jgi:hypothetical protein
VQRHVLFVTKANAGVHIDEEGAINSLVTLCEEGWRTNAMSTQRQLVHHSPVDQSINDETDQQTLFLEWAEGFTQQNRPSCPEL